MPNFPNITFNNQGCVPTSFLMYASFANKYSSYSFNLRDDFPTSYNNNEEEIQNKIIELGINYFNTDHTGTSNEIVIPAIQSIPNDCGYYNLYAQKTSDFSRYTDFILYYKNPCLINVAYRENDIASHYLVGTGYKTFVNNNEFSNYIIANEVSSEGCFEITFPYNNINNNEIPHVKDFVLIGGLI